ncbi:UDP-glucuronosyltransferase 2B4-like isoform X1 [Lytechinus variegatus]|uniref:UDP-glucuronosyltransferase 2B4-like isoform X1 n=1 Tax=Lytechinus variegatus TaxID=7654 RepID=UPI001BB138D4|nr:UDP-glucuronosyltransferase 2B4-like isoform X1 [Lytechinus variegatus]
MAWVLQLALISAYVSAVWSANIFISVTYGEGSHYLSSTSFGAELVRRGHNVTYLISNAYENRAHHPEHSQLFHYEIFNHSVPLEKVYKRTSEIAAHAFNTDFNMDMIFTLHKWLNPLAKDCRAALSDRALLERLRNANFDYTILDLTWSCSVLLAAYLETPIVLYNPLASQYDVFRDIAGTPFIPAVVPEGVFGTPQRMNFKQRVVSFLGSLLLQQLQFKMFVELYDPLRHEFGILEDQTITDYVVKNTDLILTASDPVIDLIHPLPPNIIEVGGLLTRAAKPLEKELDDFMNSSGDDGVIILSLGTYVKVMPQRLNDVFASVFANLPQKVIWQLPDNSPTTRSPNIKTMGWLPQNDLLGHPRTKLFIYQGGNNGLYEALYHGVPTLVLPVFADQLCVASRVTEKGMGSSLDIHTLSAENLDKAIRMILSNNTYADTAKRLSAIYRDRPETPAERAAFWVEHVIKFGGKYMESPAKHLNFIQLSLLDVIAFLIFCLVVVLAIIFFSCRCIFRCCFSMCKDNNKKKKD